MIGIPKDEFVFQVLSLPITECDSLANQQGLVLSHRYILSSSGVVGQKPHEVTSGRDLLAAVR
jgi:hypothetical protein